MAGGLCECGCGEKTTSRRGVPRRFVYGHQARGELNPRAGVAISEETRARISSVRREQGTTWWVGRQHSEEARARMSASHKGRTSTPRRGITIQCEVCGKEKYVPQYKAANARFCSLRCLGLGTTKKGKENHFFGKTHTEETKEKCRRSTAKQRSEGFVGPSTPERRVHEELLRRGIVFETEVLLGEKFCVDILIRALNLVIYVDGCYWHACPEHCPTAKRPRLDASRVPYLTKCGFRVVLLWEHDIKHDVQSLIAEVLWKYTQEWTKSVREPLQVPLSPSV